MARVKGAGKKKAEQFKTGVGKPISYRHPTLMVRQGKDGTPEAKCPSCEEYIPLRYFIIHNCPKSVTGISYASIGEEDSNS